MFFSGILKRMDPTLASSLPLLSWAVFAAAAALSLGLGGLLAFHWFRYAMNRAMSVTASIVYFGITCFLLSGLLAATIAIVNTV